MYEKETNMDISKDLVAASATPLILSILSEGESYGYAIIKRVAELSGGKMKWTDGMLYPILHRLEKQGLIKSETRTSETGRKRKYYYIKQSGTKAVKSYQSQWQNTYTTLLKVWEAKPCL
jgi:PadR family transcriptional regulator PadR